MISTAQTGFFYTTQRVRQGPKLAAVKYDPVGAQIADYLHDYVALMSSDSKSKSSLRGESEDEEVDLMQFSYFHHLAEQAQPIYLTRWTIRSSRDLKNTLPQRGYVCLICEVMLLHTMTTQQEIRIRNPSQRLWGSPFLSEIRFGERL